MLTIQLPDRQETTRQHGTYFLFSDFFSKDDEVIWYCPVFSNYTKKIVHYPGEIAQRITDRSIGRAIHELHLHTQQADLTFYQ